MRHATGACDLFASYQVAGKEQDINGETRSAEILTLIQERGYSLLENSPFLLRSFLEFFPGIPTTFSQDLNLFITHISTNCNIFNLLFNPCFLKQWK
jgi:hypothetical protein